MIGAGVDIDQTPIYLALRRTIAQHAHSLCKRTIDQHRAINQRDIIGLAAIPAARHDPL